MRKPEEKGGANTAGPCPARARLSAELRAQFGNLCSLPEAPREQRRARGARGCPLGQPEAVLGAFPEVRVCLRCVESYFWSSAELGLFTLKVLRRAVR